MDKELNFENSEEISDQIKDDMVFQKARVDPKLVKLQKKVTTFVTSVILKHEREFYKLVYDHIPAKLNSTLCTTNKSIIEMITKTTNKLYNNMYWHIQHGIKSDLTELILSMCQFANYGPHILLDKLVRLTIEVHLDIWRENLILITGKTELYEKSILIEINKTLSSLNLLHILSKGQNDDIAFINIPPGQDAFNIVIDKNIQY